MADTRPSPKPLDYAAPAAPKGLDLSPLPAFLGILFGLLAALTLLVGVTRIIWTIEDSPNIDRGDYIPTVVPTLIGVVSAIASIRWIHSATRRPRESRPWRYIIGTWGVSAFDNDDANDWIRRLEQRDDLSPVESALQRVEQADQYLEASLARNALAACEVLARLAGNFGYRNETSAAVDQWVDRRRVKPSPELLARASSVIDRIVGPKSELSELWDEHPAWLKSVRELRMRLRK